MNKPKLRKDFRLVDNGNLTKNLHTLHYFGNCLIDEHDNGNVENILIDINQLKQKVNQLETSITTKDNELKQLKEGLLQLKTNRDEVSDDLQNLINDVNTKTIIGLGDFTIRVEEIQDKLIGGSNE